MLGAWKVDRSLVFPPLADAVDQVLAVSTGLWYVTQGFRTAEEQDADYAKGRSLPGEVITNARAGESPHNFGLAVDVTLVIGGKDVWDYDNELWRQMIVGIKLYHLLLLKSGDTFLTPDSDHIELFNWRAYKSWHPASA